MTLLKKLAIASVFVASSAAFAGGGSHGGWFGPSFGPFLSTSCISNKTFDVVGKAKLDSAVTFIKTGSDTPSSEALFATVHGETVKLVGAWENLDPMADHEFVVDRVVATSEVAATAVTDLVPVGRNAFAWYGILPGHNVLGLELNPVATAGACGADEKVVALFRID